MKPLDVSAAAAALGRRGGLKRTKAKQRAARRNAKKGGWPQMGVVYWKATFNGVPVGEAMVRRVSRASWGEILRGTRFGDGWGIEARMTPKTAKLLEGVPTLWPVRVLKVERVVLP